MINVNKQLTRGVLTIGEALQGEVAGVEQLAALPALHAHRRRQDLPGLQARQDLRWDLRIHVKNGGIGKPLIMAHYVMLFQMFLM